MHYMYGTLKSGCSVNGTSLFLQVADGNRNEIQNQEVNKRSFIGMEHVYFYLLQTDILTYNFLAKF